MTTATQKFDVTGMTCAACSTRVEKVTSEVPGVQKAVVNLLKNSMEVEYDGNPDTIGAISAAVDAANTAVNDAANAAGNAIKGLFGGKKDDAAEAQPQGN